MEVASAVPAVPVPSPGAANPSLTDAVADRQTAHQAEQEVFRKADEDRVKAADAAREADEVGMRGTEQERKSSSADSVKERDAAQVLRDEKSASYKGPETSVGTAAVAETQEAEEKEEQQQQEQQQQQQEQEQEQEQDSSEPAHAASNTAGAELKVNTENSALETAETARVENEAAAAALVRAADDARANMESEEEARRIAAEGAADKERTDRQQQQQERRSGFEVSREAMAQQHTDSIQDKEASDKQASEAAVKKLSEIATDAKSREGDLLKNARQAIDKQHEDIQKQLADADDKVAADQQQQQQASSKPSGKVKSAAHKAVDAKAAMAASHKLKVVKVGDDKASKKSHKKPN